MTLYWVILIFKLFVLSTGNKLLVNSNRNINVASRIFDLHIFTWSPFWFLIFYLKCIPVQSYSRLLDCKTCVYISCRANVFVISNQAFSFFSRNSVFWFLLVDSTCDAYLAIDHSLVYSWPKMFLPFFYSIILSLVKNLSSFMSWFLFGFCSWI